MTSHDLTRFYALIPAFAITAIVAPQLFLAITGSIGAVEALMRLTGRR